MSNLLAFDEPEKLISWADKAIQEAGFARWHYFRSDNFDIVVESDAQTGNEVTKYRMRESFPPCDFSRRCTEALNNLRNSFDQSLFAACDAICKPVKDAHYPWSDNPTKLNGRLKGNEKPGKSIPVELWDTIRAHEPYPTDPSHTGGNDLVREMSIIANAKHTTGFKMNVSAVVTASVIGKMFLPTGVPIMQPAAVWDPVNNEIELRYPAGVTTSGNRYQVEAHIAFDVEGVAGQMPAETALGIFSAQAHKVFETLKARAVELGAK